MNRANSRPKQRAASNAARWLSFYTYTTTFRWRPTVRFWETVLMVTWLGIAINIWLIPKRLRFAFPPKSKFHVEPAYIQGFRWTPYIIRKNPPIISWLGRDFGWTKY